MIKLEVKIEEKSNSYPIFIDCNLSNLKSDIFDFINGKNCIFVISEKVYNLYGKILDLKKETVFILKDGENQKNFKNYKKIIDFCLNIRLTRDDFIIAIGGGVVGDIAGFVASTYMRGINFIQVPTTLLACVDSSVGGKTAINSSFGKNLIGSFYQPNAVFIYTDFLKTLDDRNFKSGLGEVVKYAFIEKSCCCEEDFNLINFLETNNKKILEKDSLVLSELIKICILLKISVVQKDEKESGLRRILNFGHTYGHAVEKITKYKKYTHGECVIEGIYFAFDLALKNSLIDKNYTFFMQDILKKFDFKKIQKFKLDKIMPIMKMDKKASSDFVRFILPTDYSTVKEFRVNDLLTIF